MAQISIQTMTGSYDATAGGNEYVLGTGRSITSPGGLTALDAGSDATGRSFSLHGEISSKYGAGVIVGDFYTHGGKANTLVVGSTGTVSGLDGLIVYADEQWATNQGTLKGTGNAGFFGVADDLRFTNAGTVEGKLRGVDITGDGSDVINQGTIRGESGIALDGTTANVSNNGLIEGTKLAIDATGITLGAIVSNRGTINGNVTFGAGNDVYQNDGGTMNGIVRGGAGDDLYYVDKAGLDIREAANGGSDFVYASVSWTLGSNFEDLILYGDGKVNGTGNDLANRLIGNDFDNRLSGGAGRDEFAANRGNDVLRGGGGADTFLFEIGNGHDRILDFGNGADRIELDEFDPITSYGDLMKHHLTVKGDDLVISAGDDALTLVDVSRAELDKADFIF
ncbi:calcium-binding protein [Rhizobium sp. KVB221]|uniref:Calcium-binding protein n=1 Tax=Rhizobium setariae TaxID=2801340 RepID=A0A936YQ60_9HYPH|nr:calcium-binding protein [Rhizobium setariae]MBL0370527.1 calcium-binding protein [Rhizobium setariae]